MSTLAPTSGPSSLDAKRAKLAARLHQASSRPQSARASFGQERLWFLDQLHPGSPLYNIPMLVRLTGRLNLGALKSAFNVLVSRHEALRTRFSCVDATPMQFIEPRSSFELQFLDLEGNPNPQDEAATYIRATINEVFDLARAPLLRATVLRLKADEHLLVLNLHHIVADEWSLKVLFRELSHVYERSIQGEQITLQPLPIQYADYAVWQRTWLSGKNFDDLLAYWKDQLSGNPPVLELLPDHSRGATPCFQGAEISRGLPQKLSEDLKALAAQKGVTLFMLLLAGFKALLHRYTGQEDLLLASPIAGRNRAETENLIGFFVNMLLLRSNAGGDPPFCEFLARVRRVTLGAYEHQELPFEKLIEHLQPERSLAHLPYSKVMFLVQNQLLEEMELPGLRLEFQELTTDTSKFELTVVAQEIRQGLVLRAQYNTALFETGTIDRLLRYFETLLEGIVANPAQRLSQLPLLTAGERHQLLVEWNRTQTPYPADQCIHRVFETKAAETPEATALVFGEYQLTYQELNTRANQLAHYLRQLKVGPEVPVALMVERSREMVIGMLGILKAGGAYVPLDPAYPRERLAFMLADSGAPVVLTQQRLIALLPPQAVRVIALDTDWELINTQGRENPAISAGPDSLAYIMYTSGSTGQPKGVAVVHRAVNRLVLNTNYIRFDATDRIAQLSNISFDAATFEIWGALLNGGQLVGIGQEEVLSPKAFGREIQARGITGMFLTAALFNQLASEAPGSLRTIRTVIAGGEALDPKWVRAVLKHQPPQRLVNGYGPTENTTFTCCGLISELSAEAGNVPIGRPIANTQVYILDAHLDPVPIGVPGELHTGGDGLARGYWNRPGLTAEKFVKNPYGSAGRLLYKTGDLARYLPDGRIEFLGRLDQQVKIRGFRIELGEIENALAKHPGVRDCVVTLDGTGARTKRLVAYIVPANQLTPNTSELRKFLGQKLPDFMIPSAFIALARLPLTANGKVDRKALPAPECARPDLEKQYTAARNPEEAQLVTIWENVLGVRPIGIEDKFFELGGHSLLAVKLLGQIEKAFGKKLRLATIFQAPTVAQLAAILREEAGEARPTSIIEIQPQGQQRPLFLVHGAGGGMFWGYVNLSRHLGLNQPIYGFKSRGLDGFEEFPCLEDMAAHYLEDLRRIQPEGPYHIGGYCFGGIVAYEMARQLAQQEQQVALLALFNCAPPNSRYTRIPWTPKWALRLLRNLGYWVTYALSWTPSQRREFVRWKLRLAKKRFEKLRQRAGTQSVAVQAGDLVDLSSFTQDERKVWEAHIRALVKYEPRPFTGRLHLFRTSGHALWCSFDPDYGWGDLAKGGVEVTVVPGAHEKILKEPFVAVLADKLRAVLSRIQDVANWPEPGIERNGQPTVSSRNEPEIQNSASGAVAAEQQPSNRVPLIGATSIISGPRVAFPVESTYAQQFAIQAAQAAARNSPGTRQIPLSARQRRLWLLEQFHLTCSPFNRPVALRLAGPLEVEALRKALTLLAARHDALRAVFPVAGGEPSQSICAPTEVALEVLNLENVPEAQREEAATTSMAQAARSPYILKESVLRPLLLRLGPQEHRLLLLLHEITVDSRSVNLLLKELARLYETVGESCQPLLPEIIAYDELTGLEAGSPSEQEEDWNYWQRQLAGLSDALDLPADRPRPAEHSGAGSRMPVVVQLETLQMLEKLAAQTGCSTFSVLLAAFASVLHRYTSNSEVVIGSVVSAQPGEKACQTVANFENPVALRCNLEDDPTFLDLLKRAESVWTQAKIHSRLPFAELVDRLAPERKMSYTRLFQTAFLFQPEPLPATRAGGVSFTPIDLDNQTAKLDLSLCLAKNAFGLSGWFEYSADLFDSERVKRLASHFVHLLSNAVASPETRVSSLPLLTDAETGQLLSEWNRTETRYPKDDTIASLFLEQAARTPEAEAVVWGAERVTYRQLRQRALQFAAELSRLGITSEKLVGICLERSPDMIAAMLGTLLAGGAYVPLDPAYPAERLAFIMEDAQAQVLLTQRKFLTLLTAPKAKLILVDELRLDENSQDGITPELVLPQASNLAYVIYTSGSTGRPKGVALEHRNAAAFIHWARSVFNADELSGVLASTSICFDLSIFEIFVPLTSSGRVILAENSLALPTLRAASEVTLVNTVPSAIRELLRLNGVPSSVRTVNLAGEPLAASLVDQIYAETSAQRVYDLYGPSETTTYSTFALRRSGEPATIGRPLANEQVYVLDSHLQPVAIGVPGELFIGGDGLARGYLNRPELTAEKFIPHPFKDGARVYRTGDLARWRADAYLEYIGRRDHQVKIRGFRIELGEIESVLKAQPNVREAVVVAREEQPGDKRLVAYLVAASETAVSVEQLRERLRSRLPEYMIPPDFVFLKELPLTPNGKLDRKALPAPQRERRPERPITQPHTVEQEQVLAIWRQVLGLEHIGIRDNFFDLGGHSLLATQVISRMRELFHVELPLAAFFAAPTIEALASGLESGTWLSHDRSVGPHRVERKQPHPLSFVQERLWFLDQLGPGSHAYHVPMALRLEGELNLEALRRALQQIVCRHEALRTTLPYEDGRLIQKIAPDLTLPVDKSDISNVPSEEHGTRIREWLAGLAQKPFDLTCGPLLRCAVLRLAERQHIFMVVMHHAISDGWSLSLFFQELSSLYNAYAAGAPAPALSELPLQYVDFAHWQRDSMQGAALESEAGYWRNKLASAPVRIELPADRDLPASPEGKAGRSTILLDAQLVQGMNRMGQAQGCTPFMLLMSALAITLHKWCEQRDLVIGTVVAGRTRREFENVFGCFMNFLPIRARLREEMSAEEALAHVRAAVLEGQTHQDCPFEKMVEAVNPERRLNQNPLYNVALLVQNFPSEPFRSQNLRSSAVPVPMEDALLDLRFEAERSGTSLGLSCEYRVELFAKKTVDHLLAAMVDALRVLLTRSETKLQEYQLCEELIQQRKASRSKSERQALAVAATFTAEPLAEPLTYWLKELQLTANIEFAPYNQVFQQLLTPGSLLTGNARGLNVILLRLEDWQQATASKVSSADQNLANDLGRNLEEFIAAIKTASVQGSVPYLVGLCPPSTAALADPARAELLAEQEALLVKRLNALSGVYVLTYEELQSWYPVANYNDATSDEIGHIPYNPTFFSALATGIARKFHALQRSPCKVIVLDCDHTLWSGVCGEDGPTGLGFEPHRTALHDFALAQKQQGKLLCLCSKNNEEDVWQVFQQRPEMALRREHLTSWRINWQPKSENIKALARELGLGLDSFVLLDDNPVECAEVEAACPEVMALQLPDDPAMLPHFLNHCWVFDQLKVTTADRRRTELYHEQQQRETLRSSSTSLADFIAGLELKIVNEPMLQEQVERVAQLTQRTNQFNTTSLRRSEPELLKLAADGDVLAVQVSDRFGDYGLVGVMVCQTCDNALKVDSFLLSCRVLGRGVEHSMLARAGELARRRELDWVDVHFVPSARNKPALDFLDGVGKRFRQPLNGGYVYRFPAGFAADVAFCPASTPTEPVVESDAPAASLPAASVKKFTRCREIALQANDPETIHRRIEERRTLRPAARGAYAAPHSEVERRLCDLWKDLLKVEPIGVLDDFFDLGGHSLLAVRLFAEIERLFGRKLPLVTLFQAPTIQQLAELLSQKPAAQAHPLLVPLQPRGSGTPLFLVHGAGGDVLWGYANLVNYLSREQPVYGIKSRGQAGLDEPASLEEMAARYLDAVRAFQPQGPYYLGGYCFGGNVAYEMARQLELQGERVALVALLDSAPANAGYESMKWWRPDFMVRFIRNFAHWSQDFATLKSNERRNFVLRKFRALGRKVTRRLQGRGGAELVDIEEVIDPRHFASNELRLWQAHLEALARHVEKPFGGKVTLLRTRGQPLFCSLEEDFCWGRLAKSGVVVKSIPGSHENIFLEPNVRSLAAELAEALAEAQNK